MRQIRQMESNVENVALDLLERPNRVIRAQKACGEILEQTEIGSFLGDVMKGPSDVDDEWSALYFVEVEHARDIIAAEQQIVGMKIMMNRACREVRHRRLPFLFVGVQELVCNAAPIP